MKCFKLRCEYLENPIGIDVEKPRLSWQIESKTKNVYQKAYRIQCCKDKCFDKQSIIWDSGMVLSSESVHIEYKGPKLKAFERIYWRVLVETNIGKSEFSELAYFEMGFLDSLWKGEFITSNVKFEPNSPCPVLKKKIFLKEAPSRARIYITALGMYHISINGKEVDQDLLAPGWTSYNNHLQYQNYDIRPMLVKGENIISVTLGSGWYMGRIGFEKHGKTINKYGDTVSLLAQLFITNAKNEIEIYKTDTTWKCDKSGILFSGIYDGEYYDAREESTKSYDELENAIIYKPKFDFKILGQVTKGVRVIDKIKPVKLIKTKSGDWVIDFGQNMVGWVKVRAKGNSGDIVYLKHGEILLDGEFYNKNMRSAKAEAKYILKGKGEEEFLPHFTFFGFRYIKVCDYPGEINLNNFEGIVLSSDLEYSGKFECSNEKVNKLYSNILWGQKGNFVDIPSDCPQRDEKLGWTADTQVFAPAACFNALAVTFYDKWLKDVSYDQYPNGAVPYVIPDVVRNGMTGAAWGDAACIVPHTMYKFYKDKRIIQRQYESMKKWVGFIKEDGESETLWQRKEFHFNDWLAQDGYGLTKMCGATPKDLLATALYYYSTILLVESAKILGYKEDEMQYKDLANRIKESFNEEFVTKKGRVSGETQTAYTLALHFDLLQDDLREKSAKHLVELVRREEHTITTGFVGTPYIAHVLSRYGYVEDAYLMLLNEKCPGWLYQVNMGATTIWERWNSLLPDGTINKGRMNSFNHYAYGCIANWMFEVILGIKPKDGFKEFEISPKPNKLFKFAKGGFDTLYGRVESSWQIDGELIKFSISIPCNTKARVKLPKITENDLDSSIKFEKIDGDIFILLGSGDYTFNYSSSEI